MTTFVLLDWTLTLVTGGILAFLFVTSRHIFIKPSIIVLSVYFLLAQIPSSVLARHLSTFFPKPWDYLLLIHGFALVGLCVASLTMRAPAREAWGRITTGGDMTQRNEQRTTLFLALVIMGATGAYLTQVPITRTGLYAIITHPVISALAREQSLKLITNTFVRYTFSLTISTFAPLLAGVLALQVMRKIHTISGIEGVLGILVLTALVSLPGARMPPVSLLLTAALVPFLRNGLPVRPLAILLILGLLLSIPAALTVLRQGQALSSGHWYESLTQVVLHRAFVDPMEEGAQYVYFAQVHGAIGITGIPKLATLLGREPINAPNLIGLTYSANALRTVNANAGYLFSYYGYFGLLALPLCLICLWILDLVVLTYRRLSTSVLVPTIAALMLSCVAFALSDYTTVIITHGFLPIVLTALILSSLERKQQLSSPPA